MGLVWLDLDLDVRLFGLDFGLYLKFDLLIWILTLDLLTSTYNLEIDLGLVCFDLGLYLKLDLLIMI